MQDLLTEPPVVVLGPRPVQPGKRVEIRHKLGGRAYSVAKVVEFACRARLEDLDPETVAWRGGGLEVWET